MSEEWTENGVQHLLIYIYDASGAPIGMAYRDSTYSNGDFDFYLFAKNIQGDILYIYNTSGTRLVTYTYDAWGNVTTSYSNGGASTAARHNPFRYRGYYYDTETGFYYLNSRYYDPEVGRFLNADGQLNTGLLGYNLFAYCENNPVMYTDYYGCDIIKCWHHNNPDTCIYCKKERGIAEMAGDQYPERNISVESDAYDDTPIKINNSYSSAQTITSLGTNAFALLLTVTSQSVDTTAAMYVTGFGYCVTAPINIVQVWNNPNLNTSDKVWLTIYDVSVAAGGVTLVYGMANWWNVTGWTAVGVSVIYTFVTLFIEDRIQKHMESRYYHEYER